MDKIIKNGRLVLEEQVVEADLLIRGEKIAAILAPGTYEGDAEVIDAAGMVVMPGTIDPHMHMGLYKPLGEAFRGDTPRQAIGGLTTLINYHRGKGNYFETVQKDIEDAEANSLVDFAISLGLCAKVHLEQIEDYVEKLGITTFKFFFDKQDIAHQFYDIPKEAALTLDKADLYFILKQLAEISPKLMLCVHCEDPD
ncbi:MAG: amidohydrolase family protein, partial [Christensenellaceae bacterium]|nr:amidohydrolase family protein [Christensenellaceae bacterium]